MTVLSTKDRTVLELISQRGAMSRSEVRELVSQRGVQTFQARAETLEREPGAENVIDEQINALITRVCYRGKP